MVTVDDLSLDNLSAIPVVDIKLAEGQAWNWADARLISDDTEYRLYFGTNIRTELENGTDIRGADGYMITRAAYNEKGNLRGAVQAVAFWETPSPYSSTSDELKEEIVESYNATIGGDEAVTEEEIDNRYRNEAGETNQEVADREAAEEAARMAKEAEEANKAIAEDVVIREYDETMAYSGGGEIMHLLIIEKTRGTGANPTVTYVVERRNDSSTSQDSLGNEGEKARMWEVSFETQAEAETYFDDFISEKEAEHVILGEEHDQFLLENETTRTAFETADFYYTESTYSFKNMLEKEGDAIDWDQMPIWRRALYAGHWEDAIAFSNGGDTLELNDFDVPRVTAEGISENPSGAVAFTVRKGWKLTFSLETDSSLSFINNAIVDGVAQSGNTFDFTMYSGDRLEIDIDNEREAVSPFFVSIKGNEWFSATEIDDEVTLTLISAEKLMVKVTRGHKWVMNIDGTDYEGSNVFQQPVLTADYELAAWEFDDDLNTQWHVGEARTDPEYSQLEFSERTRDSPEVPAEASFTTTGELAEPIVDAASDAVDTVADAASSAWDSTKWWILGGVIAIAAVILIAVYVNGRARTAAVNTVAPPTA